MIRFFSILLASMSAASTGVGLVAFFAAGMYFPAAAWATVMAALVMGAVLSLCAQVGINVGWAKFALYGFKSPAMLAIGIVCSLISWVGSAAGLALFIDGEQVRQAKQTEAGAAIVMPLNTFALGFSDLQAEIDQLSRQADSLAQRETLGRVTCDGDKTTGEKCGPKCRLRQRHAASLSSAKADIASVEKRARDIAVGVASTQDAAKQRSLYAEAVEVQANADQKRVALLLRDMAGELTNGAVDPQTGSSVTCTDSRFAEALGEMADKVETRISLPAEPPEKAQVDISDTAVCVVLRVGDLVGLTSACSRPVSDLPLILALPIELALIGLAFHFAAEQRRQGLVRSEMEDFVAATQERRPEERRRLAWLLEAEGLYVWQGGRQGPFIAIPTDGAVAAGRAGLRFKRLLGARGKKIPRCPIQVVDPNWCRARAGVFGPATRYDLYPLPRGIDDLFRRLERDFGLSEPE